MGELRRWGLEGLHVVWPLLGAFVCLLALAKGSTWQLAVAATGLATVAALSLQRHRASSPTAHNAREELSGDLHLAFDLTQAVNRATVVEEVYAPALDTLLKALAVTRASILLFDPDGVMRFKAWRGLSDGYRRSVEGHTPWTQDTVNATPILTEDVALDPELTRYWHVFAAERIRALAFIPLVYQGKLLGKFMVYSERPRRFTEREVRVAQTVAAQVATAVARARLFESERTYANECASAYERERQAVTARDQFIAIASHELKTPLTALKLNAHLLDRYTTSANMPARNTLNKLSDNVARLERLVFQLLDFSRLNGGKLVLDLRATDLGAMVAAIVQRAQPELARSGSIVQLVVEQPVVGIWDQERLDQVVTNLLQNAIKYGQGKPITVRVARDGDHSILEVRDRGIGIAPQDQARVFERFERAVSAQHFGGFGLGLWIVRALVEAHGGHITVRSTPGEGATFRVELPTRSASTEIVSSPENEAPTPPPRPPAPVVT